VLADLQTAIERNDGCTASTYMTRVIWIAAISPLYRITFCIIDNIWTILKTSHWLTDLTLEREKYLVAKREHIYWSYVCYVPSQRLSLMSLAAGLTHCSICFSENAFCISLGVHSHHIRSPVFA